MEMNEPVTAPTPEPTPDPTPEEEARLAAETQRIRRIIDAYAAQTQPDPARLRPLEDWVLRLARAEMLRGARLVLYETPAVELAVLASALRHRIRDLVDAEPHARARRVRLTLDPQTGAEARLRVSVDLDLVPGGSAPEVAGEVRARIAGTLGAELGVAIGRIDVSVRDVATTARPASAVSADAGKTGDLATVTRLPVDPAAEACPGSVAAALALRVAGVAGLSPSLRDRYDGFLSRCEAAARTVDIVCRGEIADVHLDCLLDGSRPATAIADELGETIGPAVLAALHEPGSAHARPEVARVRVRMRVIELGS